MRKPSFAGSFYEADPGRLDQQIRDCFLDKYGPGALPSSPTGSSLPAIVVPHAGYVFSGACAAWAYKSLAEANIPDVIIIIGPNHSSPQSGISLDSLGMPFGIVRADQNFGRSLAARGNISIREELFVNEHSVEVQIPFLQFIYRNTIERLKILPILLSVDVDVKAVALDIKECLMDENKTATIIISSDFTHYGPRYGYSPFTDNIPHRLTELNKVAIAAMLQLNRGALQEHIARSGNTICGHLPIELLTQLISTEHNEVLTTYNSGDVVGDYENTVVYVSAAFA